MLLQISYLLAKLVPHYLQVGNCVWCFKNTEDVGASWRVESLSVYDLNDHLKGTTTFTPYL